ncbi:MAG: glycosyltransferase family 4 protein [Candidatus Bipolaricaulia bacterium]
MQNLPSSLKTILLSGQWVTLWIPFLITGLSCPLLIRWGPLIKLSDSPRESARKIHHHVKPLGGAALLVGLLPVILLYGTEPVPLVFAVLIVFITGLTDDVRGFSPGARLILQIGAAAIVVTFYPIPPTHLFPGFGFKLTGTPNLLFTVFWLVGGTNAFNLIDGLDGLATGIGIISLVPLLVLTFGHPSSLLLGGLVAALVAFLFYNFYPAKLFLGDGGSYLVGFTVSYLVIHGLASISGPGTGWSLAAGTLILGVPVLDTILAIIRRAGSEKRIVEADQEHLHHKFYRRFGHVTSVLVIYLIQAILVGFSLLVIL